MTKIFQTLVDGERGNCMQACIASLLDLTLEEVPNFIELESPNYESMVWLNARGFDVCYLTVNNPNNEGKIPSIEECLEFDGGVIGLFYASVRSQTFKDNPNAFHAVICDKKLNVIHDPNPNQLCIGIGKDQFSTIMVLNKWHIDLEGKLVRE